jgi:predicted DNA-binding transcriptional regulator YafY
LALHFWGQVWTLAAWCELRDDFRTFRVDRAESVGLAEERFPRIEGRTLNDYLGRMTRSP